VRVDIVDKVSMEGQILVVNGYSDTRQGQEGFARFLGLVHSVCALKSLGTEIHVKRLHELHAYVLDWEHEVLVEAHKDTARRFDKLECVFVCGDGKELVPWETRCFPLVTLLHMCNYTHKPCVCISAAVFVCAFALASRGKQMYLLNGPVGEMLERLPYCNKYAVTHTPHSHKCVWLDHETGDVYEYQPHIKAWVPIMNTGFSRLPSSGLPITDRLRAPSKKWGRNDRLLSVHQGTRAAEHGCVYILIHNACVCVCVCVCVVRCLSKIFS